MIFISDHDFSIRFWWSFFSPFWSFLWRVSCKLGCKHHVSKGSKAFLDRTPTARFVCLNLLEMTLLILAGPAQVPKSILPSILEAKQHLELLRRMTSFDHTLVLHCVFIYLYLHLSLSLSLSLLHPQDSSPSKLHNDLSMMDGMRKQTLSGVLCRQLLTKLTHDINGPLRTFFGSHKGRLAILTSVKIGQHKASKSLSPHLLFNGSFGAIQAAT